MIKIVKYLLIWLSGIWLSILIAVLFGREEELARAASVAAQGTATWLVRGTSALSHALVVAGHLALVVADTSGTLIAGAIRFLGENAADCVLFTGRALAASGLFAGAALSASMNYAGFALSRSLDYLGASAVATWRFFIEVLTNLASRTTLFAIFFIIFMYHFFMKPAQLRQLIADALFVPVRDACKEVWRCVVLVGATLWSHAVPSEALKVLAVALLATHLWQRLLAGGAVGGGGDLTCAGGGGSDAGRVKLDVYS